MSEKQINPYSTRNWYFTWLLDRICIAPYIYSFG